MPSHAKPPWVSVKITISLKNPPQNYIGWKSQTVSIGQDEPADLVSILFGAVREISEWYANFMVKVAKIKIEEINQAIVNTAVRMSILKFKFEKINDTAGDESKNK